MPPVAVDEFQAALTELSARSGQAANQLVSRLNNLSAPEARAFITDAYPALLAPFLAASGQLTTQWYAEQPAMTKPAGSSLFVPEAARPAPPEQLAISGRWALTQSAPTKAIVSTTTRHVQNASRDTVIINSVREGVRWVRKAQINACGFCKMLATRSSKEFGRGQSTRRSKQRVYSYKSEGVFKDEFTGQYYLGVIGKRGVLRGNRPMGSKYHENCKCIAVPVRDGIYDPPEYVEEWTQEYDAIVEKNGTSDLALISKIMDEGRFRPDRLPKVFPGVPVAAPAVIPPEPVNLDEQVPDRSVLDNAETVEQAAFYIRDKHGIKVDQLVDSPLTRGVPIQDSIAKGVDVLRAAAAAEPRLIDARTAREFGQAVDDMLEKYPFLQLDEIKGDYYPSGDPLSSVAHAQAKIGAKGKFDGANYVAINSLSDSVKEGAGKSYQQRIDLARGQGQYRNYDYDNGYKGVEAERPVYAVIIHEMGHVVDYNGGGATRQRAYLALRRHILDTPEAKALMKKLMDEKPGAMERLYGNRLELTPEYEDFEKEWFRENLVSAYSFTDSSRVNGVINMTEALAEAFADVELRGDAATIASKIMHKEMIDAAREYRGAK